MMKVAIHQPNYLPWFGYFAKMLEADLFILIDDAAFSKGSFTNRVRIRAGDGLRWLTAPVRARQGTAINATPMAKPGWTRSHRDVVKAAYADAPHVSDLLATLEPAWAEAEAETVLAGANGRLLAHLAAALCIDTPTIAASTIPLNAHDAALAGDERLVALVRHVAPAAAYLSGRGAQAYQDPEKFRAAGLGFAFSRFVHPVYAQPANATFTPGLSVIDAAAELGWTETARLVRESAAP